GLTDSSTGTVLATKTYSLALTFGTDGNQHSGAWIDYDHDGVYSSAEFLGAGANPGASGTTTITFTVPATAYNGITRMRIIGGNDAAVTAGQACGASSSPWGETQDYDITIVGGSTVAPYGGTITSHTWTNGSTIVGTGNPVTITNLQNTSTYTDTIRAAGCYVLATSSNVVVNQLPTAPNGDATQQAQCGTPIYTFTSTTTGIPIYNFFTTSTGGTSLATNTTGSYSYVGATINDFNTLYVSVRDSATGCTSARTQSVDVFASDPDPISVSTGATKSTCVGRIETISVTSPLANYDSYVWSPTTNLYTNAAATIPYTGDSRTTVYYKRSSSSASDVITLNTNNSVTTCSNAATITFTVNTNPVLTNATATPATVCSG
ncbi:MAG: GEVED domain-containing protein, partial [Dolichospermum sp.]